MFLYLSLIETEEDKIKFEAIFNNYKKIIEFFRLFLFFYNRKRQFFHNTSSTIF